MSDYRSHPTFLLLSTLRCHSSTDPGKRQAQTATMAINTAVLKIPIGLTPVKLIIIKLVVIMANIKNFILVGNTRFCPQLVKNGPNNL